MDWSYTNITFQTKLEVYGLIVNVNNGGTRVYLSARETDKHGKYGYKYN